MLRGSASSAVEPLVLAHANRARHAQLLIGAGELPEARALLDGSAQSVELGAARVDLSLAVGDLDAAATTLRAAEPPPDDVRAVIGQRLREAAVLDARGERAAAQEAVRAAVAAAEGDQLRWPRQS